MVDPVLLNDWHPVAATGELAAGTLLHANLLDAEIVLWRGEASAVRAWTDRCPHRGTRLSCGRIEHDQVICAYHGWHFGGDGRFTLVPSQPDLIPPEHFRVQAYQVRECYGLIWVCLGTPAHEPPPFPEFDDPRLRKVVCGPYEVASGGPRIVENFLDMAHFGFVHEGILGDRGRTGVRDCEVAPFDDGHGGTGILATNCWAWQPQTNSLAHGGADVEYTYRVVRPLTAILTKVPQPAQAFREAISLHVQPVGEETSRVWIVLAMTNFEQAEVDLRAFQDRIFLQDKPILENQVPRRLPLMPGVELPVRADRMSLAYRAYLRQKGLRYGCVPD
jgi:phenylpropionate dioxygenase-like ring-hydroxylating dioxygenase large terminal subunit